MSFWKSDKPKKKNEVDEIKDAFQEMVKAYHEAPQHEKDQMDAIADKVFTPIVEGFLGKVLPKQNVFTHKAAIISYSVVRTDTDPHEVDSKLKDILDANPSANVRQYARALGIRINTLERKGRAIETGNDDDMDIGKILG